MKAGRTLLFRFTAVLVCFLTVSAQEKRTFGLEALSPTFWDLVDRNAKLEKVAADFGFTEGPMWDPA
ncbi:MAG TPA: hypothetical protein VLL05_12195, partial [Terriglobales bacterium]|nr:hypothetical protein [Terriglobales bacterium]